MKQHLRLSHASDYQQFFAPASRLCSKFNTPGSPCEHCGAITKAPRQHPAKRTVLWHSAPGNKQGGNVGEKARTRTTEGTNIAAYLVKALARLVRSSRKRRSRFCGRTTAGCSSSNQAIRDRFRYYSQLLRNQKWKKAQEEGATTTALRMRDPRLLPDQGGGDEVAERWPLELLEVVACLAVDETRRPPLPHAKLVEALS